MEEDVMKKNSWKYKKIVLLVLTIILGLGTSLAAIYFMFYQKDSRTNSLSSGLISIDYNESETVFLSSNVPVIDEVGLETTPYEFTVQNTSIIPIDLKISLNIDKDETNIPLGAVRYGLYINDELVTKSYVKDNSVLYTVSEMQADEIIECKLYMWVDYYYDVPGNVFEGSIMVEAESRDVILDNN